MLYNKSICLKHPSEYVIFFFWGGGDLTKEKVLLQKDHQYGDLGSRRMLKIDRSNFITIMKVYTSLFIDDVTLDISDAI
jgi:hypothetical protein